MQTTTEKLFSQIQAESSYTSSLGSQILDNLKRSKEYRHAFVEEKVQTQIAVQIKTIREQRDISRPAFAALIDKSPSWVFRLEDPNQPPPTIKTLLRVAEAYDVDLEIRFRRFSELVDQIERMTPETFKVASFGEEVRDGAFDRTLKHDEIRLLLTTKWEGAGCKGSIRGAGSGAATVIPMPVLQVQNGGSMKIRRTPRLSRRRSLA